MNKEYRYSLDDRIGRNHIHECPECGKREFRRYVDWKTEEYIADHVGRCNRLIKCGYHVPPREYFKEHQQFEATYRPYSGVINTKKIKRPCEYLDFEYVVRSQDKDRWINDFTKWVHRIVSNRPDRAEIIKTLISKYYLGGSSKMQGAVVFWQIDINGKVRTGKIMKYNQETGKRIKDPNHPHRIDWVHYQLERSKLISEDFNLKQCFFGEHLLSKYPEATVAVFESEKTAIVASIFFPDLICIASGGLTGLNSDKCKVLKDRNVIFFPDLGCYSIWKEKVESIARIVSLAAYAVNDILEENATEEEKAQGLDLCDYIVKELVNIELES
jgi:hypothetical protein